MSIVMVTQWPCSVTLNLAFECEYLAWYYCLSVFCVLLLFCNWVHRVFSGPWPFKVFLSLFWLDESFMALTYEVVKTCMLGPHASSLPQCPCRSGLFSAAAWAPMCLISGESLHGFLVGVNKSYIIATSDSWLFIHTSNLQALTPHPASLQSIHVSVHCLLSDLRSTLLLGSSPHAFQHRFKTLVLQPRFKGWRIKTAVLAARAGWGQPVVCTVRVAVQQVFKARRKVRSHEHHFGWTST